MENKTNINLEEKETIQYSIIIDDGRDEFGNYDPEKHMPSSDNKTSDLLESMKSRFNDTFESLCNKMLGKIVENIVCPSFVDNIKDILNEVSQTLRDYISNVIVIERFAGRKTELLEIYSKWGSFGWTPVPGMPIDYFNFCPSTILEADKKILSIINEDKINFLFDYFRKESNFRKSDLIKAISFYKRKEYKACAYFLFSVIDAILIKTQKKTKDGKRKVGRGAIKILREKSKAIIDDPNEVILPLDLICLIVCLEHMYGDTHDFACNQEIINRNSLCHGMYTKKIRKKDCIKLFLVLYNLLDLLIVPKAY